MPKSEDISFASTDSINSRPKKEPIKVETVFKYSTFFLITVLIFCLPGFFSFRQYCVEKGYYVFSWMSSKWFVLGFTVISIIRYSYYRGMRKPISKIVKVRNEGEERERKIDVMLKLSYDTIFYASSTIICYYLFREQHWFPWSVGGNGSCSQIYNQYPNWPKDKRPELEGYFMFHLGVHVFSVVELFLFRRGKERKFYEWMLHHSVAATLILFSMMSNQIAAGVMILIVHDASDIFMAAGRFYAEANIPKSFMTNVTMVSLLIFSWIYLRLFIFPFCLLANVYINKPLPTDEWYMINYQYMYLLSMAFVLVAMHIYWTFCLFKSFYVSFYKKQIVNNFDVQKKK